MNYFRITAYNKEEDYSIIADSYGAFNELWEFSSSLVQKGFSIIAVGTTEKFNDGNIPKVNEPSKKILLRSTVKGPPIKDGKQITVGNKSRPTKCLCIAFGNDDTVRTRHTKRETSHA